MDELRGGDVCPLCDSVIEVGMVCCSQCKRIPKQEVDDLFAEQSALEQMLSNTPIDNVLDRISLQMRLNSVDKRIEAFYSKNSQ